MKKVSPPGSWSKRSSAGARCPSIIGVLAFLMLVVCLRPLLFIPLRVEPIGTLIGTTDTVSSREKRRFSTHRKGSLGVGKAGKEKYLPTADSCFKPHPYFRPESGNNLAPPYINVGFPKTGTTSLMSFLSCGGLGVTHQFCRSPKNYSNWCGVCMKQAIDKGELPITTCGGKYEAFLQLDMNSWKECVYPQIQFLDEIHQENPQATFLLGMRNVTSWYNSLVNWDDYNERLGDYCFDFPGYPEGPGSSLEQLKSFYCWHVERIRQFVIDNPSHTLVEIDIEDEGTGRFLSDVFGMDESCWGHTNANPIAHGGSKKNPNLTKRKRNYKGSSDD